MRWIVAWSDPLGALAVITVLLSGLVTLLGSGLRQPASPVPRHLSKTNEFHPSTVRRAAVAADAEPPCVFAREEVLGSAPVCSAMIFAIHRVDRSLPRLRCWPCQQSPLLLREDSSAKRIVLNSNDVSRIGVQTIPVREEKVVRRVVVLGKVEDEPTDNAATDPGDLAPTAATVLAQNEASSINDVQIRVLLDKNPADDADDDADQYDDEDDAEIVAPGDDDEDETPPVRAKRVLMQGAAAPNTLYFKVKSGTQGLQAGQSVGVRLADPGSNTSKKVVPYSAILYDLAGDTWVYTNPEPSVFVREQVDIERIDKDLAVLNSGPAAGTQVVTIGAVELYGAEFARREIRTRVKYRRVNGIRTQHLALA